MEILKKQLFDECHYRMREETMALFIESMTEIKLKAYEDLIPYGALDTNIYVIKSGIIRGAYFDGFKERTFAFGTVGLLPIFNNREPSFFKLEACCDSVVMKVNRTRFVELTKQSHDFATWIMWMSIEQLRLYERKLLIINGDAKERFEALVKNRPEIIEKVPAKYVASYIGITPQYLSFLKSR